jgi:hypothetical protein
MENNQATLDREQAERTRDFIGDIKSWNDIELYEGIGVICGDLASAWRVANVSGMVSAQMILGLHLAEYTARRTTELLTSASGEPALRSRNPEGCR